MKFLSAAKSRYVGIEPGIYRTRLLRCKYIHFKSTNEICGIQFNVAWETDSGEYRFCIFLQHLEPVLRRLVDDLKMKRLESYPDGEEERFMVDLSGKLPIDVQVSVRNEQVKGKTQQRFSLRAIKGGVDSPVNNGGGDVDF